MPRCDSGTFLKANTRGPAAASIKSKRPPHASTPLLTATSACACGGGCPRCAGEGRPLANALRADFERIQATDFSQVRVHPQAHAVTAPLQARAVTYGQDIYFHPGQFQPGTPAGDALIGHELAHTRQARPAQARGDAQPGVVSQPGDALERNADALAGGYTAHALPAPAGAALRSPFDNESADDRARRERLIQSITNAIDRLLRLLQTGGLIQDTEAPVERSGVRGIIYGAHTAGTADEVFTSYPDRDARIRRLIRVLMAMARRYRTAPIPADFSAPAVTDSGDYQSTVTPPPGGRTSSTVFAGATPDWVDLQAAYERYRISQGQTNAAFDSDWYYLDPSNRIVPGAARGAPRMIGAVQTGIYMVVPDADHDPLRYWRLTGTSPTPQGSVIVEFWHDDFGYYYTHRGQRVDVPDPWAR